MNIFLDTTIFNKGKDVFMNGLYNKLLLNITQQNNFKMYISEVVIKEARRQYQSFIASHVKNVRTAVGAFNHIPGIIHIDLNIPEVEKAMEKFDEYYRDLEEKGIITIVGYDNDILPELVERAIQRIKPFSEGKQEFRDAIIWLSYAKIAEEQQLENCLFVTGNTADYCSKNKELHPDLLKDSKRFTLYADAHALVQSEIMKEFKENHEALQALREKKWGSEELTTILKRDSFYSEIELAVNVYISEHKDLSKTQEITNIEFDRSWILSTEFLEGEYIMRGVLVVKVTVKESRNDDQETSTLKELYEIDVVYQAVYNKKDNNFESIQIEGVDSEYDYDGAHVYQDLH